MKKILIAFLFFVLLHFTGETFAGSPGYLGKNFTIGYLSGVNPIFINESVNQREVNLGVNYFHNFQIGYSTSRRYALALQYERSKGGFMSRLKSAGELSESTYFLNYEKDKFSLQLHNSLRGAISPLGSYTSWSVFVSKLSAIDPSMDSPDANIFESQSYGTYIYPEAWNYGILFGYGRKFALTNFLLLDIGMEANFFNRGLLLASFEEEFTSLNKEEMDLVIRDYMHGVFKFYVGLHFLAF